MNSGDGLENLGIVREGTAVTSGQDVPLFAMGKGMADSTLKCNPLISKKKREAGDAKPKHFLGLVLIFWRQSARYAEV